MTATSILDEAQRALLRAVLNRLLPARPDLPGAGDLDVGASIERDMAASPRLRRMLLDGLTDLAITSERHTKMAFVDLDPAGQVALLESAERDSLAFFTVLVEHTYRGYYTLPAVLQAIGAVGRPPQPIGYQLEPFDPVLLDQQRQRAPFWRRT